jgi:hypothetical protein
VRWWTDNEEEVTEQEYQNVTLEGMQFLISENPSVQILVQEPDPNMPGVLRELRVRFVKSKPLVRVLSVPLDEFRVSRKAKDVECAPLIGHDQIVNASELVKQGYTLEAIANFLNASPRNR